jgi:hypothetical protein
MHLLCWHHTAHLSLLWISSECRRLRNALAHTNRADVIHTASFLAPGIAREVALALSLHNKLNQKSLSAQFELLCMLLQNKDTVINILALHIVFVVSNFSY